MIQFRISSTDYFLYIVQGSAYVTQAMIYRRQNDASQNQNLLLAFCMMVEGALQDIHKFNQNFLDRPQSERFHTETWSHCHLHVPISATDREQIEHQDSVSFPVCAVECPYKLNWVKINKFWDLFSLNVPPNTIKATLLRWHRSINNCIAFYNMLFELKSRLVIILFVVPCAVILYHFPASQSRQT